MPKLDRRDFDDVSLVDADELQSSGSGDYYRPYVTVLSTTGSTGRVRISGFDILHGDDDDIVAVGDIFYFTGSLPAQPVASSSWRVDSIIDSATFTVSPSISTSVFGTGSFRYPPGAKSVGASSARFSAAITTGSNVQAILDDLGVALGSGIVTGVPPNFVSTSSFIDSTTTSISFINKLSARTNITTTGSYYIIWYCELTDQSAGQIAEVHTLITGTTGQFEAGVYNFKFATANVFVPFGGFSLSTQSLGSMTASIEFRVPAGGSTALCRRASIGIWRVA